MKNIFPFYLVGLLLFSISACNVEDPHTLNILPREQTGSSYEKAAAINDLRKRVHDIYGFTLFDVSAQPVVMQQFQGKVLLIVNTASRCGYTGQFRDLQKLYRDYQSEGLEVLGFPSNDFGGQELETNEEIALFAKTRVRGSEQHPLFSYLTTHGPTTRAVRYNFEKFLVNRTGKVIARYSSDVVPLSEEIRADVGRALAFSG